MKHFRVLLLSCLRWKELRGGEPFPSAAYMVKSETRKRNNKISGEGENENRIGETHGFKERKESNSKQHEWTA